MAYVNFVNRLLGQNILIDLVGKVSWHGTKELGSNPASEVFGSISG